MVEPLEGDVGRSFKYGGKEYWVKEIDPYEGHTDHIHIDFKEDINYFKLKHIFSGPPLLPPSVLKVTGLA